MALHQDFCDLGKEIPAEDSRFKVLDAIGSHYPPAYITTACHDFLRQEAEPMYNHLVEKGVKIVGGCCGTTPDYIQKTVQACKSIQPLPLQEKDFTCISSYTHAVYFDKPVLIGERINPTGKKRFKQALIENNMDYIISEAIGQEEKGADMLDVNVGLPEIDEPQLMEEAITGIQAIIDLPLQIDTSDPIAMERALRIYNGKPMICFKYNKVEDMEPIFALIQKYGGALVDENMEIL